MFTGKIKIKTDCLLVDMKLKASFCSDLKFTLSFVLIHLCRDKIND